MKLNRKVLAAIAGVAVIGVIVWRVAMPSGGGAQGPRAAGPVPVLAGDVTERDVPIYLNGIGTVQAYNTVTIKVRVDGELVNVAFREGQEVKKGDVLAQIDPRPYQATLDSALAVLAKDQASLANARRDLARYQDTSSKGFSSRQQFDTQGAVVNSLTAVVQADQAVVENARVQLGYTTIVSPLDGRTGIRTVDQGNIVRAADATGLVVITQVQPISTVFTMPQDQLPKVSAGMAKGKLVVTALSRDNATELGKGTLELIDNQIDPTTGTVRMKARFPNEQDLLWPGQFINVRLEIGHVQNGLTVASRAVQRGAQGPYAYVVKADNTVELRQLEVGQDEGGQTLITKGLNAGEHVVLDGQLRLQPGAKVQVAPPAGARQGAMGMKDTNGGVAQDAAGPAIR